MSSYRTYQETDSHIKDAVIDHIRWQFRKGMKSYAAKDLFEHFKEQGIELTRHWLVVALRGTRYAIRTRGWDGEYFIFRVDDVRYFASGIKKDEDKDASISFGLNISIHRVERFKDKKIVPFELSIRWFFWTWRQVITIFL